MHAAATTAANAACLVMLLACCSAVGLALPLNCTSQLAPMRPLFGSYYTFTDTHYAVKLAFGFGGAFYCDGQADVAVCVQTSVETSTIFVLSEEQAAGSTMVCLSGPSPGTFFVKYSLLDGQVPHQCCRSPSIASLSFFLALFCGQPLTRGCFDSRRPS